MVYIHISIHVHVYHLDKPTYLLDRGRKGVRWLPKGYPEIPSKKGYLRDSYCLLIGAERGYDGIQGLPRDTKQKGILKGPIAADEIRISKPIPTQYFQIHIMQ